MNKMRKRSKRILYSYSDEKGTGIGSGPWKSHPCLAFPPVGSPENAAGLDKKNTRGSSQEWIPFSSWMTVPLS
jgi:hypothetical protein